MKKRNKLKETIKKKRLSQTKKSKNYELTKIMQFVVIRPQSQRRCEEGGGEERERGRVRRK